MDYLQAAILAVVEGLTEFLPVSSTGHLVLTSKLLNIEQTDFVKSFEIIIQLGAILAIVFLYWDKVLKSKIIMQKVIIAFLPTAFFGFIFYQIIKEFLIGNTTVTLLALFFGGIVLIFLELIYKEKDHHAESIEQLSFIQVFLIGISQSISMIPGVSRAAATIIGGMFVGAKRKTAVEFSFLLAVPTMLAASGLDIIKSEFKFSASELSLLAIGFIGSFFVAIFAVKYFLKYIQNHTFISFGIYRIILAILYWFIVMR